MLTENRVLTIASISTTHINSIEDVKAIIRFFTSVLNINFHPYKKFYEYMDAEGKPVFSPVEVKMGENVLERMFQVCGREQTKLKDLAAKEILEQLSPGDCEGRLTLLTAKNVALHNALTSLNSITNELLNQNKAAKSRSGTFMTMIDDVLSKTMP